MEDYNKLEKYIFEEIIFKKAKYKIYFEDHDEVTFNYTEVNIDTLHEYIHKLIEFLETELADFQYDLYTRMNGVVTRFEEYIITGKLLASYMRRSNISVSEGQMNMLQYLFEQKMQHFHTSLNSSTY